MCRCHTKPDSKAAIQGGDAIDIWMTPRKGQAVNGVSNCIQHAVP